MSTKSIETQRPAIGQQEVLAFADEKFGITGELKELVSDRDQNFSITSDTATYVFKIANSDEVSCHRGYRGLAMPRLTVLTFCGTWIIYSPVRRAFRIL